MSGGQKQRIAIARALLKVSFKPLGQDFLLFLLSFLIRELIICNLLLFFLLFFLEGEARYVVESSGERWVGSVPPATSRPNLTSISWV